MCGGTNQQPPSLITTRGIPRGVKIKLLCMVETILKMDKLPAKDDKKRFQIGGMFKFRGFDAAEIDPSTSLPKVVGTKADGSLILSRNTTRFVQVLPVRDAQGTIVDFVDGEAYNAYNFGKDPGWVPGFQTLASFTGQRSSTGESFVGELLVAQSDVALIKAQAGARKEMLSALADIDF